MDQVHTFIARDGSGTAASAQKDGSNLPGGTEAWEHRATLDADKMVATSGVIGVGNAAEILDAVRRRGFFLSAKGDPELRADEDNTRLAEQGEAFAPEDDA